MALMPPTKLVLVVMFFALAVSIDVDGTCENGGHCVQNIAENVVKTSQLSVHAAIGDTLGLIQSGHILSQKNLALKDNPIHLPKKDTMQKLTEVNASVDDIRELLVAGATPGIQGIIEDLFNTVANNLQHKVKHDQNEAKKEVLNRIGSLNDTTKRAVDRKQQADQFATSLDRCVAEELQLLEAHRTCKSEEATLSDEKESKEHCGNDVFNYTYSPSEDFCTTFTVDYNQSSALVTKDLHDHLSEMKRWVEDQENVTRDNKVLWDSANANCTAKTAELKAKKQMCVNARHAWRYQHDKCLHVETEQKVALCAFGYEYHIKCASKLSFDTLKGEITTPGTTWSEPDRLQEWTHSERLLCVLDLFNKSITNFTGTVDTCKKTPKEAADIFAEELGFVDFQDDNYTSLTSDANFNCTEADIMVGNGVLWTVPSHDNREDAWVPNSTEYKKATGHKYAIESNSSKPPFAFCYSRRDHGLQTTCGIDRVNCGTGSPKNSSTQCYLNSGCTKADCCDDVYTQTTTTTTTTTTP